MTQPIVIELHADGRRFRAVMQGAGADSRGLKRDLDGASDSAQKASRRLDSVRESATRLSRSATSVGRTLSLSVTAPLVAAAAAATKLAIDAEETANKFNVVFGPAADQSRQQLQALTDTIPLTLVQMQGLAAGVQDLLVPMGVARDEAAGMSVDMVKLAGDLASFNNVGTDQVLNAMQSALAGSSEPMRRFGVDTRVTKLEQIALEEGLIGVGEELNNTARAQATLIAITRDSTDAIGDAERTVDSAANQLRFLQRDIRQLGEELGENLIPAVRELVPEIRNAVSWFGELDPATQQNVIRVGALAAAAGPAALALGGLLRAVQVLASPVGLGALALAVGVVIGYKLQDTFREWAGGAETIESRLRSLTPRMDRFTGSVARMRDEFLRSQLDQARAELEALERVIDDVGARSRLGVTTSQLDAARQRVEDLNRQLEINEKRWEAHNRRVIEADNGIGGWGSSMVAAIETAMDMAASVGELSARLEGNGDVTDQLADSFEGFVEATRGQIESLREERLALRGGTRAVLDYRIAKLAATGASEEMLNQARELRDELLQEEEALEAVRDELEANEKAAQRAAEWMQRMAGIALLAATNMDILATGSNRFNRGDGDGAGDDLSASLARAMSSAISAGDGRSMGDSIGNALRAYGTEGITEGLQDSFRDAFEALEMDVTQGELQGYSLALGHAVAGQMGAAIGAVLGTAIGAYFGGAAGAQAGAAIGSAIGGLFDEQKKRPRFNFGEEDPLLARKRSVTPDYFNTAFGEVAYGSTGLDDQTIAETIRGIQEFDRALATAIERTFKHSEVSEALKNFAFISEEDGLSLDQMMQARLDAALSAMDTFVAALVKRGDTIEDQLQRLMDVFDIQREMFFGRGLGLSGSSFDAPAWWTAPALRPADGELPPGAGGGPPIDRPGDFRLHSASDIESFNAVLEGTGDASEVASEALQQTLFIVEELSRPSETLADTFQRLRSVTEQLDYGFALLGTNFAGGREALIRFGDDLSRVFGDDLDRLGESLDRVYSTFFTAEERARVEMGRAAGTATGLLESAGIDVTADMLTLDGFRKLWDDLFMTLGPEGQALLIEAGVAVADLIDAEEALMNTREQANREYQRMMQGVMDDLRDLEWSPLRIEMHRIAQGTRDAITAWREAGGAQEEYNLIMQRHTLQTQALAGTLRASLADMRDQLFGSNDIGSSMQNTASQIGSSMQRIQTSMIDAIKGVQDWLDSSLLDSNSPLMPKERLDAAGSQFWDAIDAAKNNDAEAASQLPKLANQFLGQANTFWGTSTAEYRDIWQMVRDAMQGVAGMDVVDENGPPTYGQTQNIVSATRGTELNALEQARMAGRMIDEIGVLARISEDATAAEIARELDIPIGRLIEAVTGDLPGLTGDALDAHFNELVAETDQQLNALGRIEEILSDIRTAVGGVDAGADSQVPPPDHSTNPPPKDPPALQGTHSLGSETFIRPDAPQQVADPETRRLLAQIEKRLASLEQLADGGNDIAIQQVGAIREGSRSQGTSLEEMVRLQRRLLDHSPVKRISP